MKRSFRISVLLIAIGLLSNYELVGSEKMPQLEKVEEAISSTDQVDDSQQLASLYRRVGAFAIRTVLWAMIYNVVQQSLFKILPATYGDQGTRIDAILYETETGGKWSYLHPFMMRWLLPTIIEWTQVGRWCVGIKTVNTDGTALGWLKLLVRPVLKRTPIVAALIFWPKTMLAIELLGYALCLGVYFNRLKQSPIDWLIGTKNIKKLNLVNEKEEAQPSSV